MDTSWILGACSGPGEMAQRSERTWPHWVEDAALPSKEASVSTSKPSEQLPRLVVGMQPSSTEGGRKDSDAARPLPQHHARHPQDRPGSPRPGKAPSLDMRTWAQLWGSRTERKTTFLVLVLPACWSSPQDQGARKSKRQSSHPQGFSVHTARKTQRSTPAHGPKATGMSQCLAPPWFSCTSGRHSSSERPPASMAMLPSRIHGDAPLPVILHTRLSWACSPNHAKISFFSKQGVP